MKKALKVICIAIPLVLLLLFAYLALGFSNDKIKVDYEVTVENPGSGYLNVRMVVYPAGKPYLHLFLRDPKTNGIPRIKSIEVNREGKPLAMWQTLVGMSDCQTVWNGFSKEPIEINYRIDATWAKGNSIRSYLGPQFGYLRAMNILFMPITLNDTVNMIKRLNSTDERAGMASIRFSLPEHWGLNSPWNSGDAIKLADLRNVYFGVGDMSVSQRAGEIPFSLAVYNGLEQSERDDYLKNIPIILSEFTRMTGIIPVQKAPYRAITILPHEPIYGGASGTSSLVTENTLEVLAHEIFHWWNGETIDTTKDANWIKEGFTKYYEVKVLVEAGLMTPVELKDHMARIGNELYQYQAALTFNMAESSERLIVGKGSQKDSDAVYYGGAHIAYYIDKELGKQNKSLDEAWKKMLALGKPISSKEFYNVLSQLGGQELANECEAMVNGKKQLPIP